MTLFVAFKHRFSNSACSPAAEGLWRFRSAVGREEGVCRGPALRAVHVLSAASPLFPPSWDNWVGTGDCSRGAEGHSRKDQRPPRVLWERLLNSPGLWFSELLTVLLMSTDQLSLASKSHFLLGGHLPPLGSSKQSVGLRVYLRGHPMFQW